MQIAFLLSIWNEYRVSLVPIFILTLSLVSCVEDEVADSANVSIAVEPKAPVRPVPIGSRTRTANWSVKVLEPPIVGDKIPETKGFPVLVKILVKNIGKEGSSIWSHQFELQNEGGRVYKPMTLSAERVLDVEDINPGLEWEGYLVFDVSLSDRRPWNLVIEGALFSDPGIINIGAPRSWDDRRRIDAP